MKTRRSPSLNLRTLLLLIVGLLFRVSAIAQSNVISFVDTSRNGSEKFVLRVDGKPYYMTEIQVRLDKLHYNWNFDAEARDRVMAQAAKDGFNTVSIPLQWYEVEPEKDHFAWNVLDEYLGLCKKHNLKMELLWFGQNSYGTTGFLISGKGKAQLRTPKYVMYSPGPGSAVTTSNYRIRRDISNYTLDMADAALRDRETYILSRVMAHIADWDKANGSPHVVIGVQLDNEVRGKDDSNQFPDSLVISYLSHLGSAIKKSPYIVWTRINSVDVDARTRIDANYHQRVKEGTNIDFVGIDLYDYKAENMRAPVPSTFNNGNYNMICESGAQTSQAAIFQMAALSGNVAYDHYDLLGPDGHGLYNRKGATGFEPHGSYINDVRILNKLFNGDIFDLALKANGKSLFVHNWNGNSTDPTTGVDGVKFTPATPSAQAISIKRSKHEFILINIRGGKFDYPANWRIVSARQGYFDRNNHWNDKGKIPFKKRSISPPANTLVRVVCTNLFNKHKSRLTAEG